MVPLSNPRARISPSRSIYRPSTEQLQRVVNGYGLMLAGLVLTGRAVGGRFGPNAWLGIGMLAFGAPAGRCGDRRTGAARIGRRTERVPRPRGVAAALIARGTLCSAVLSSS